MRTEYGIRDMIYYDEDGNEIPDEELPWSDGEGMPAFCDSVREWTDPKGEGGSRPQMKAKAKIHVLLLNAENDLPKACGKKRFVDWSYLLEQRQNFKMLLSGMTEKKKVGCEKSVAMRLRRAICLLKRFFLTAATLYRTAWVARLSNRFVAENLTIFWLTVYSGCTI